MKSIFHILLMLVWLLWIATYAIQLGAVFLQGPYTAFLFTILLISLATRQVSAESKKIMNELLK